ARESPVRWQSAVVRRVAVWGFHYRWLPGLGRDRAAVAGGSAAVAGLSWGAVLRLESFAPGGGAPTKPSHGAHSLCECLGGKKIPAPTPEPASRQAPSVVIPAQLQHHLVARRIQLAELAPGAQAQAQIAVQLQLQLLGQADMAADLAVVKVVGAGFEQQVASAIAPQESRVKAGGRAQGGGKIRMMLDPQGGQAVGQQLVVQHPAEASATIEMAHQALSAVLAG